MKIKGIENELKNSLNIKNETFNNELEHKLKKDKSYYIYGDKGASKTSSLIQILTKRNEKFFYYDCTYDKFMELIFVNNNYIYKLVFFTLKWLIKRIYKIIIIDDIHLSSKENILEISEWLENYKKEIIVISPQNFRYVDIYNYGNDYETISNVMDKLYSRHNLNEITIGSDTLENSYEIQKFMLECLHWINENKRVIKIMYKIKSKNIYNDFYKKIVLLTECMMSERGGDLKKFIQIKVNEINEMADKKNKIWTNYTLDKPIREFTLTENFKESYDEISLGNGKYDYEISLLLFFKLKLELMKEQHLYYSISAEDYYNFLYIMDRTVDVEQKISNSEFNEIRNIFKTFKKIIERGNIYGR